MLLLGYVAGIGSARPDHGDLVGTHTVSIHYSLVQRDSHPGPFRSAASDIVGTVTGDPRRQTDLPTVDAASITASAADAGPVAGILLAAGTSSRFGESNKLLANVTEESTDGEPIVRRAARTLVDAHVDPVISVLGHEATRVGDALADLPVRTVVNDDYRSGQASSVRTGIEAVRRTGPAVAPEAVVIALGDMPFVSARTVDSLVAAYAAGVGDALAPAHDGVRGNPVLFDRRYFDDLAAVEGDVGGRQILLEGDASALVVVDDPGVRRDVDTRRDL